MERGQTGPARTCATRVDRLPTDYTSPLVGNFEAIRLTIHRRNGDAPAWQNNASRTPVGPPRAGTTRGAWRDVRIYRPRRVAARGMVIAATDADEVAESRQHRHRGITRPANGCHRARSRLPPGTQARPFEASGASATLAPLDDGVGRNREARGGGAGRPTCRSSRQRWEDRSFQRALTAGRASGMDRAPAVP